MTLLFQNNKLHFQEFSQSLKMKLEQPLPGNIAHQAALPPDRKASDIKALEGRETKKAAVLILIENNENEAEVVFILRSTYKGAHSGQISFPGGKRENSDANYLETALRETEEEIGIKRADLEIMGALSPIYIPPSNFLVYPYVAISHKVLAKKAEEKEVAGIYNIDLERLFAKDTLQETDIDHSSGQVFKVPAFNIKGLKIWGATAMILAELKHVVDYSSR